MSLFLCEIKPARDATDFISNLTQAHVLSKSGEAAIINWHVTFYKSILSNSVASL